MTPNHMVRIQAQGSLVQKKREKKATKSDTKRKSDAILTYRHFSLRKKTLCETRNLVLGGGEDSGTGGKETKHGRQVGKSGGKYIRQTFTCAVAILREETVMLIGGI